MDRFGFLKIATVSPRVHVANPMANAEEIVKWATSYPVVSADIVLFPELCVTGYTCADLFTQGWLIEKTKQALYKIALGTAYSNQIVVVGAPIEVEGLLYNCAVVLQSGKFRGIVPKQFLPTYKEFYESRWFQSANGSEPVFTLIGPDEVPFGVDLLFETPEGVVAGIEICEDLWMPIPPSSLQCIYGAQVLLNLSASNELVGKADYRKELVTNQSGRCIAAYAYAGAGPSESTTDIVMGGHCLIAESGRLLVESQRVGTGAKKDGHFVMADVDIERLKNDRRFTTSFGTNRGRFLVEYRTIPLDSIKDLPDAIREPLSRIDLTQTPFVPAHLPVLNQRCSDIFEIQCHGLMKRLPRPEGLVIGISGGLDSTLAALVLKKADAMSGPTKSRKIGITMRGYGTTNRTYENAVALIDQCGFEFKSIDIRPMVLQKLKSYGWTPFGIDCSQMSVEQFQAALTDLPDERRKDLRFENIQARCRTEILMDHGFVIGTGDLSEIALGWCTYNADHMSMYNVNCSVPKTLVKWLVRYVADHEAPKDLKKILLDIVDTEISPELLPLGKDGKPTQSTEDILGPYVLHDFFLYHFIRNGFTPEKILYLAKLAFDQKYSEEFIAKTLDTFMGRFFANQFKRSCVPDGPKVGSVSLSPRGDWRMPSDLEREVKEVWGK